jgi:hypothetical protein
VREIYALEDEVETCLAMMSWEEASVTPPILDSDQQLTAKNTFTEHTI